MLLITGLGTQLLRWPEAFCERLVGQGHRVIRFDNRDTGLSTRFEAEGTPNITRILEMTNRGETPSVPYRLSDMAADTVGLMDALGIEAAHLAGMSMGGMIAQTIAFANPERVLSLTSIMSSSGRPGLPGPRDDVLLHVLKPPPRRREAAIEYMIETDRLIAADGLPGALPVEPERIRDHAVRCFDRGWYPAGSARQLAAILASGSRVESLGRVRTPTLVIHGTHDPLVPPAAGKDTAACIPAARFMAVEGMGHYLSAAAWPSIIDAISELTRSVSSKRIR
jgi:pimeloyl-ACP methyl ester carboxylesterase